MFDKFLGPKHSKNKMEVNVEVKEDLESANETEHSNSFEDLESTKEIEHSKSFEDLESTKKN